MIANIAWILSWHNHRLDLALVFIFLVLIPLAIIYERLEPKKNVSLTEWLFTRLPFSIYLAWILISTVGNLSVYLVFRRLDKPKNITTIMDTGKRLPSHVPSVVDRTINIQLFTFLVFCTSILAWPKTFLLPSELERNVYYMTGDAVGMGVAFLAGILSFFSPCVLPLIPAYLATLAGVSPAELQKNKVKRKPIIINASGFIIGFSITFVTFGITASAVGMMLTQYQDLIMRVGGLIIVIFGLQLMGIINLKSLLKSAQISFQPSGAGFFKALIIGFVFSAGWTPCIGPVLSSILILAGSSGSVSHGATLLALYSLGLAIPFLLAALFVSWILENFRHINTYLSLLNKAGGLLLIILGIMLFANIFTRINALLI